MDPYLNVLPLVFLCSNDISVVGVFYFDWDCNACSCFESTNIVSCACVRLWGRSMFILARLAIASLSSIAVHGSACSTSEVMTWVYVLCVWFFDVHTYGPPLLPSCGSDSACWLVKYGPWTPAIFFGQPACLPTVHRIFPWLMYWGSDGRICWLLSLLGLGC